MPLLQSTAASLRIARSPRLAGVLALAALALAACGGPAREFDTGIIPMDSAMDAPDERDVVQLPDIVRQDIVIARDASDGGDAGPGCDAGSLCGAECVDTRTDVHHCGNCTRDCTTLAGVDPVAVRCVAGACNLRNACQADRGDCNTDTTDGCETDLLSPTNCGACHVTCIAPTPMCTMGAADGGGASCSNGCVDPTPTRCGTACVDTRRDVRNCGACGRACAAPAGGTATCNASTCGFVCGPGTHACGTACVADTAPATCGASCTPCPSVPNGTATCDGASCGVRCNAGLHACGDACVSNSSTATCGASCAPCPAPANATPTCDGTACGYTCNPGFDDCDRDPANGCETDLRTTEHCGACAIRCGAARPFCNTTGTTPACDNGCGGATPAICGTACVNTATDPTNCGACDNRCPVPANGRATCAAGVCGVGCTAGFHLCGGVCVTDQDVAHCGASCTPCPAGDNGTATCDGTVCAFHCDPGAHLCGGACVLDADPSACGSACTPCPTLPNTVATCTAGACGVECRAGYVTVGTDCIDIDECASGNGGCDPMTTCTNLPGSRLCGECPAGYVTARFADGSNRCDDADECAGTTNPCGAGLGTCSNVRGTYRCICGTGYTAPATGGTCSDFNDCGGATNPCGAGAGSCSNMPVGSYTCICHAGYTGPPTGGTCTDIDECAAATNPCGVGIGICSNTPAGTYTCTCPIGYSAPATGGTCMVDPCSPNPCMNSGTCTALSTTTTSCTCTASYVGSACQTPAVTLASYNLGALSGTSPNCPVASMAASISATPITRGSGVVAASFGGALSANTWPLDATLDQTKMFTFTVTPTSGARMTLNRVTFRVSRSGTGPQDLHVRSSVDGFAADLPVDDSTISTGATARTVTLSGTGFVDQTVAITFRIYGTRATGTPGTFRLGDGGLLNVTGAVSP